MLPQKLFKLSWLVITYKYQKSVLCIQKEIDSLVTFDLVAAISIFCPRWWNQIKTPRQKHRLKHKKKKRRSSFIAPEVS